MGNRVREQGGPVSTHATDVSFEYDANDRLVVSKPTGTTNPNVATTYFT